MSLKNVKIYYSYCYYRPVPNHDIEPLHTYRGHTMPVNSVAISSEQRKCYSASMDSTIRVWKLPESKITPHGPVGN